MINKDLKNLCVNKNDLMKNVLLKIQKGGKNGVFVVEKDHKLLGIITDSDIRKKILENKFSKIKKAKDIMKKNFVSIKHSEIIKSYKILINTSN